MSNPNPKSPIKRIYEEEMAAAPLSVRVSADFDKYVRSLPNRTEWLRKAIARQIEEDLKNAQ